MGATRRKIDERLENSLSFWPYERPFHSTIVVAGPVHHGREHVAVRATRGATRSSAIGFRIGRQRWPVARHGIGETLAVGPVQIVCVEMRSRTTVLRAARIWVKTGSVST